MVDTNQVLIVASITVMTVILAIIGIQLVFILKDVKKITRRTDSIMGRLEKIGVNIEHGYGEIAGFITGMKKLFVVAEHLSESKKKKDGKK